MDNGVDPFLPEQGFDQLPVADISVHEAGATRDRSAVSRAQVVKHENTQSPIEKLIYDDAADVPCPTRDQDPSRHAGGSIPNKRRSASSRPYPRPSSAAAFRATVG